MTRHEERVREILAESWFDEDGAEELVEYLSALGLYVDDHAPEPGPCLAALLASRASGGVATPSVRRRGSLLVAAALTVGTMGVGGVAAAAANELPTAAQDLVAELSERYLPFELPRPDEVLPPTPRPAAAVGPGGSVPEPPPLGREFEGLDDGEAAPSGKNVGERHEASASTASSKANGSSAEAGPREKVVPGPAPQAEGSSPESLDPGTPPAAPAAPGDASAGTGDPGAASGDAPVKSGDAPAKSGDLPSGTGAGTPAPEPTPTPGETAAGQPETGAAPEASLAPSPPAPAVVAKSGSGSLAAESDAGPAAKGDVGRAARAGRADPPESQRAKKKTKRNGVGVGARSRR